MGSWGVDDQGDRDRGFCPGEEGGEGVGFVGVEDEGEVPPRVLAFGEGVSEGVGAEEDTVEEENKEGDDFPLLGEGDVAEGLSGDEKEGQGEEEGS